jgi:hypothetical protein
VIVSMLMKVERWKRLMRRSSFDDGIGWRLVDLTVFLGAKDCRDG